MLLPCWSSYPPSTSACPELHTRITVSSRVLGILNHLCQRWWMQDSRILDTSATVGQKCLTADPMLETADNETTRSVTFCTVRIEANQDHCRLCRSSSSASCHLHGSMSCTQLCTSGMHTSSCRLSMLQNVHGIAHLDGSATRLSSM